MWGKGLWSMVAIKWLAAGRYWEQNLVNQSFARPADYCDYNPGMHYKMDDNKANSSCTNVSKIEGSLSVITYPADFVSAARFLGKTHVGQLDCNHFYAPQVNVPDGTYVQMDVFVDETFGYPCQISTLDLKLQTITTWAFDGFGLVIPHEAVASCSIPKILCAQEKWQCHAKSTATPAALQSALEWACSGNSGKVDCAPISPGGANFYPDTLIAHCNWAFNMYFLRNRNLQGIDACNFGGVGELVPPTPAPPSFSNKRAQDVTVLEFLHRLRPTRVSAGASPVLPYNIIC